ncbi:MAG: bifunctional transcriptional activator/DNA repair protein Ada [Verrucomicrobia bacterium]|nr:bifunctional transcriptional activator/DNA repair protein Ada [Verrucomicrobiota bacterium]
MIAEKQKKEFYRAFLEKNKAYEGIFFVGIKTTGIFCRPSCSARKAKMENCEFFETAGEALSASFRPCQRCKPLSPHACEVVQRLVDAVEQDPEKQWKEIDFKKFSVDPSTVRRQFKKRFGMTFVAYARARRMGLALKQIKHGKPVIEAQLSSGYESGSGFREAFGKMIGAAPSARQHHQVLTASWINTPLGPMLAIADENALYLLEFIDRRGLDKEIERFRKKMKLPIIPGKTGPLQQIEAELKAYFSGKLREFKTPVAFLGTPFQKKVWEELRKIPFGETRSYAEIALAIGKPSAFRAVASANGSNQLAIAIPCHRVTHSSGALGGYAGGIKKKEWLLKHEK